MHVIGLDIIEGSCATPVNIYMVNVVYSELPNV